MNTAIDVNPQPHRHPAHPPPVRRHNEPVILHVTVCTRVRQPILNTARAHDVMVAAWREATHWRVGEYVIMPDHAHFFCAPGLLDHPPIRRWTGYWKRLVGQAEEALKSVFQEDCWDTQMRTREHYDEKLSYVRENPVRRGLATAWEVWPFRGRVFDVTWM